MKSNYTHLVFILDKSGSMLSTKESTIGGFNEFLDDQKTVAGDATVTLVQFSGSGQDKVCEDFTPIQNVEPLSESNYIPGGMTALRDAIGITIDKVGQRLADMPEDDRPEKVVVIILTDGEENSSVEKKYQGDALNNLISQQKDTYKWEFVFLGANQDAIMTAKSFGMKANSSMTYAANDLGTRSAYASLSKNTKNFRENTVQCMDFDDSDKDWQADAGVANTSGKADSECKSSPEFREFIKSKKH